MCDYLIVGLHTDPSLDREWKGKPVESVEERRIRLESLVEVDEIVQYDREDDLYTFLKENQHLIDKRFLGADWKGHPHTGDDIDGIVTVFTTRDHVLSTTALRERIAARELDKKGIRDAHLMTNR